MDRKSILALLGIVGLTAVLAGPALAQDVTWVRQFGTPGFDTVDGIVATGGHAYATGRVGFDEALPGQVSAGGADVYVRQYDADGREGWTRQFGTAGFDGRANVAELDDNLYVIGLTTGTFPGQVALGDADIFVRRYDTAGNEGWTRQLGTPGDDVTLDIAAHGSGIYVFGFTADAFAGQVSAGNLDFFVLKLEVDGTVAWVRQFGTSGDDPAVFSLGGVAVDASGVYVGSTVSMALPGQSNMGDADAFLRKYDFDGNELWTDQFGTACRDLLAGVAVGLDGPYVAGSTAGDTEDPFSARCTNAPQPNRNFGSPLTTFVQARTGDGVVRWSRQYGDRGEPLLFSLAIDLAVEADRVYVAGEVIGPRNPDAIDRACPIGFPAEDIHVRAYDHLGEVRWTQQLGSTARDVPQGIAADDLGVYVGGVTDCPLADQPSAGRADAVVIKLGAGT